MIMNAKSNSNTGDVFNPFSPLLPPPPQNTQTHTHTQACMHTQTHLCVYITCRHSDDLIKDNIEKATVIDEMAKQPSAMLRSVQMLSAIAGNINIYLFISPGRNTLLYNLRCQGDKDAERHCHIK